MDSAFDDHTDRSDHDYEDEDHADNLSDLSELTEDDGADEHDKLYSGYLMRCQVWAAHLTHIFEPPKVSMYYLPSWALWLTAH